MTKEAYNESVQQQQPKPPPKNNTNRRTVVGLEAFARGGGTGTGKAIAAFRDRKQRKRRHTAQALRQYAKIMHKEGYMPGQGASRKRRQTEEGNEIIIDDKNSNETNDAFEISTTKTTVGDRLDKKQKPATSNDDDDDDDNNNKNNIIPAPHTRRHKINPYKDLQSKATTTNNNNNMNLKTKELQEKERKRKLRERRQRTRRLQQRTSKGQPIMKHLVHDILHKLEKEQQQNQQR